MLTATQWLILDNIRNGWNYWTNLPKDEANETYLWCVRNGYLKNGKLTAMGEAAVITYSPKE